MRNLEMKPQIIPHAKALYREGETLYIARGYRIFKSTDNGATWSYDGTLKDKRYTFISRFSRLLNRLLRIEPSSMILMDDGSRLIVAKKGIFLAKKESSEYHKIFHIPRGNKPLNLCKDPEGNLYFGEYILNGRYGDKERSEVHVYRSMDQGKHWEICYTFEENSIRHIHGIFHDPYTNRLWITTGDRDDECMIAYTEDQFKTLQVLKQGAQRYRAVTLLFYEDHIVYGTDTEHESNCIYAIERANGKEHRLQDLPGSVLTATQSGNASVLSTAVEPSCINTDPYATIWFSRDGWEWSKIYSAQKDRFSMKYFQYGRITFPHNAVGDDYVCFNGHALKEIDNAIVCQKINIKS